MDKDSDVSRLLPCPFCGEGTTEIRMNGQTWLGMAYSEPISVSVIHWCAPFPGPSRMIERIGRDTDQAIDRWNMRGGETMSQTDPRAVANLLVGSHYECEDPWYSCPLSVEGCADETKPKECECGHDKRVEAIAQALADAERRGMERAAKMMCSYCNDPQWPRSAIVQGNAVHIGPITGSLFPCNAMQIHSALRAQAQADKEEK